MPSFIWLPSSLAEPVKGAEIPNRISLSVSDGVNIAARLESVAAPGAICFSEDAYRQVKARLDLAVSDLGPIRLKNIAEPVRVYSLATERV
jgi:class 3 adenylate cyclase